MAGGCLAFGLVFSLAGFAATPETKVAVPKVSDPRLEFTLVASEPQIVTPIGIAVDKRNRLFVVESHTHHRPGNYRGPETDQVKVFLDTNGDGVPDTAKLFAEGFKAAMNVALSPADELYLVQRNGVVVVRDADGDGVSESREQVVELVSTQDYPHNGLSGIVFGRDGWLYLGIGENFGSEHTLRGSDGSEVHTGPGRGGKIFRCRHDGSEVQEVAAGVWNPFGLELDRAGRLFCVDNDPGGRPPCRLLHVATGGDYGYQRRYEDTHVFNGWDGELPGTLPMLRGTGESPCGIFSTDRLALPTGYGGALLVASWGDAAIEMYRLEPHGASFRATKENLVVGEKKFHEAFCPVDFAAGPDGSLYVTDWADRTSYPVHGKGRIWRLAAKKGVSVEEPTYEKPLKETNVAAIRSERLLAADALEQFGELQTALTDADPFIRSAAITALAKPVFREKAIKATGDADAKVRLGALTALRRARVADPVPLIRQHLADPDERVRFLALWWAGEEGLKALAPDLSRAVEEAPTPALFQAYLASAELLATDTTTPAAKPPVGLRQQLLMSILHDDRQPATLHAMAAAAVTHLTDVKTAERLLHFARKGDPVLRQEAIRTLAACPHPDVPGVLKEFALDTKLTASLRADAILSLTRRDVTQLPALVELLDDGDKQVQLETARALRLAMGEAPVRQAMQDKLEALKGTTSALAEQLQFALHPSGAKRPTQPAEWLKVVAEEGDAESGRRVFFSVQASCTICHRVQGRGAAIGPELTHVGRSLHRAKLVEAILDPSREVAPQYEHHVFETKDGMAYSGVVVHHGLDGSPLVNAIGVGRKRLPISQITRHTTSPLSMMPPGLQNTMSVSDFRDLIAFLLTLK